MPFWMLIQMLSWALLVRSSFLLAVNRLRSYIDALSSSLIFFALIWRLNAGIEPGLSFHIFGFALLTLLFGFPYMLIDGVLGMITNTLSGVGHIVDIPASA